MFAYHIQLGCMNISNKLEEYVLLKSYSIYTLALN